LSETLHYTRERLLFGRPLAATQSVQIRLAEMARKIAVGQSLALQLAHRKDRGILSPVQVSLAKWNNCRAAIDVAREARDLLGGAGITTEYAAIRHALNLESVITYEGTETIHQLSVGRELTGLNAF
jgi:glutaryl-CoA dehydrogenase